MHNSPFIALPLDTLHDLLLEAVSELLEAIDSASQEDNMSVKPKKRQVELLCNAIILKTGKDQPIC